STRYAATPGLQERVANLPGPAAARAPAWALFARAVTTHGTRARRPEPGGKAFRLHELHREPRRTRLSSRSANFEAHRAASDCECARLATVSRARGLRRLVDHECPVRPRSAARHQRHELPG